MSDIASPLIKRVYVDTSVVGGAFATEFGWQTEPFGDAVRNGEIIAIASDVMRKELKKAPQHIRDFFAQLPALQIESVVATPESNPL